MKRYGLIINSIVCMTLLSGCVGAGNFAEKREAYTAGGSGDIVIGIPGPISYMKDITGFCNGVQLAADEINQAGGIDSRKIALEIKDDKGVFDDGVKIAQDFASDESVVAVVGHWNTYITLPAARIYNDAGIVMLSPVVSNPDLTKKGYRYVFQNIVNDSQMGAEMAAYAGKMGYKRVVVYYADNDYGRGLSMAFENALKDQGGSVIDRNTEFVNDAAFDRAYDKWKALDFDAIFIADSMPHAGGFIQQVRAVSKDVPLFSGDGLDIGDISELLGEAAEGIVIATAYNPDRDSPLQRAFEKKYSDAYGMKPDIWAAQGYDSIMLLAEAMKKNGGPSPKGIAAALHEDTDWQNVLGTVHFDSNGEMTGMKIHKKIIRNRMVQFLGN